LTLTLTLLTVTAGAIALFLLLRRRRGGERQRALGQLLDAADGLEARLRTARTEIEAIAGSDGNPVRDAMQEMLRQRLWLQQHGAGASLEQLHSVRQSIEAARQRIDQQLLQIERARALLH
jgi:methyl-accepting chemotaxis protein